MIILAILHATADLGTRKQGENGRFKKCHRLSIPRME
jgi:hypothetical protein